MKTVLKDLTNKKNSSADISPTAGQMPRLLGLAGIKNIQTSKRNTQ
jgi:hypothetical protein